MCRWLEIIKTVECSRPESQKHGYELMGKEDEVGLMVLTGVAVN